MLEIGEHVPDFALLNQDGRLVRLSDFRGQRVVIFTFPRAGTLGCTIQACAFRDESLRIEAKNTVVLGISTDLPDELHTWKAREKLPYDLLSDPDHALLGPWGISSTRLFGINLPMKKA